MVEKSEVWLAPSNNDVTFFIELIKQERKNS